MASLKYELAGVTVELNQSEGMVQLSGQPIMVEVISDLISRQYGLRGYLVGGLWMTQDDLAHIMESKDLQQYNPKKQ